MKTTKLRDRFGKLLGAVARGNAIGLSLFIAGLFTIGLQTESKAVPISISTVPIGNAGNAADTNNFGAVSYEYRMGTTEVTNAQYVAFLNSVAQTDTFVLYGINGVGNQRSGIVRTGESGSFVYSVRPDVAAPNGTYTFADKPVTLISWASAARFANWLQNGQPTGAQDASTTEDGAYTMSTDTDHAASVTRNPGALWFLPTRNEWYKAAYYDGVNGVYYDYPTGTDTASNNNLPALDTGNSANFGRDGITFNDGFVLTDVGAYTLSASPYGTFDQLGNVGEFFETPLASNNTRRNFANMGWGGSDVAVLYNANNAASTLNHARGFRLAAAAVVNIPEPGTLSLLTFAGAALLRLRRRRR